VAVLTFLGESLRNSLTFGDAWFQLFAEDRWGEDWQRDSGLEDLQNFGAALPTPGLDCFRKRQCTGRWRPVMAASPSQRTQLVTSSISTGSPPGCAHVFAVQEGSEFWDNRRFCFQHTQAEEVMPRCLEEQQFALFQLRQKIRQSQEEAHRMLCMRLTAQRAT
jgi:hypothetical protein